MNDDYIKAVSAMIQRRMEPKIKKAFQKLEERFKNKELCKKGLFRNLWLYNFGVSYAKSKEKA